MGKVARTHRTCWLGSIVVGFSIFVIGPARADSGPPIDWWGDSSESQFSIGAGTTNTMPYGQGAMANVNADANTEYGSNSISFEQLPPPDLDAPHLPNSGAEGLSDLDSKEPPIAAAPGVAQIDPATLISISDVQRLAADAGRVSISPNRGWVYVNKPVYFSTDAVAHDRQLTVLGFPVTVHLVPVGYSWNPGDGSAAMASAGPGGPWPNGDVTHSYRKVSTSIRVGLTVEWSASFTVQGTTYSIPGTTSASSSSDPFEIREAEAVLR